MVYFTKSKTTVPIICELILPSTVMKLPETVDIVTHTSTAERTLKSFKVSGEWRSEHISPFSLPSDPRTVHIGLANKSWRV
jgi:hypothetical protein